MHLEFQSLTLKRFRSFEQEATLHFNNAGIGLYFLKGKNEVSKALGSNGAGKSSLLDALMWCLYGKTVQGLKNPDITPWSGKGQTVVELKIKIAKDSHTIKRTANPNLIEIDGVESSQEYINKLVMIPLEIIPYTIIMGQRQPLFFDLTASEKLKIFEEPLNLERWEERSQHAAEQVRGLETEILYAENSKSLLQRQVLDLDQDIESTKAKKELWESQRSTALEDKDQEKIELQKKLQPLEKKRDDADLALDRAETELKPLRPALSELHKKHSQIMSSRQEAERTMHGFHLEKKRLEEDFESVEGGTCPTCNQPLKSHKKAVEADFNKRAVKVARDWQASIAAFKQAEELLGESEKEVEAQTVAWQTFEAIADRSRDELDKLLPKIAEIVGQLKAIDTLKEEYENQDNPFRDQLSSLRRKKVEVESNISKIINSIVEKQEYCERVRYWVKGFKNIKLYTLEEILQELQITTNSMLEEFGLAGWKVEYDVERETKAKTIAKGLNIVVLSPRNSKGVKWEVWSGGEAQRLRLIGSLALGSVLLNHLGLTTNLSVFDEPTESLSKEGVVDLVELLANYAKDTKKNVWMIDHHLIESSHFVDTITITKTDKGSSLL